MADLTLLLGTVLATIFGAAGLGKLIGSKASVDYVIGAVEVGIALSLVLPGLHLIGGVLAICVSLVYVAHAFAQRNAEPCSCFGERLPKTGPSGQRWRNVVIALVALSYAGMMSLAGPNLRFVPFDYGGGVMLGLAVIVFPWTVEWLLQTTESAPTGS